jgi:hypothetical protein
MSVQPSVDLNALWKYVTDKVKQQLTVPALWRAMEAAKPLMLDDDVLVLGFAPMEAHQAGLLMDTRHKNLIEQVLESATRKRLLIHAMAAESPAEWEAQKAARVEGQKLQEQAREQFRKDAEAGDTWEAVSEQLVRKFGGLQNRGLASVQAVFLDEAVAALAEAYGRLMPELPDEHAERAYSRALERVSERVLVPSASIGQLVIARRRSA